MTNVKAYLIKEDRGISELVVPLENTDIYSKVMGALGKDSRPEGIREARSANPNMIGTYLIMNAYVDRTGNPFPSVAFIALEEHPTDEKSLVPALTAYNYEAWRKEAKDAIGNALKKGGIELMIEQISEEPVLDKSERKAA